MAKRGVGIMEIFLSLTLTFVPIACVTAPPAPPPVPDPEVEIQTPQKRVETVTADQLNLRILPSTTTEILDLLKKGESVEIVEIKEDSRNWAKVISEKGKVGWVYAPGYLTGFAAPSEPRKRSPSMQPQEEHAQEAASQPQEETEGTASGHALPLPEAENGELKGATPARGNQPDPYAASVPQGIQDNLVLSDKETVFVEIVPSEEVLSGDSLVSAPGDSREPDSVEQPTERLALSAMRNDMGQASEGRRAATSPATPGPGDLIRTDTARSDPGMWTLVTMNDGPKHRKLSIRSAPDEGSSVIAEVSPGARLATDGMEGEWYRVQVDHRKGYLHKSQVEKILSR